MAQPLENSTADGMYRWAIASQNTDIYICNHNANESRYWRPRTMFHYTSRNDTERGRQSRPFIRGANSGKARPRTTALLSTRERPRNPLFRETLVPTTNTGGSCRRV
ncbi:hypothetical protein PUN28_005759 [Cardiocondyla obscurior]|uniref:WW domain-containing protein n=1 Tax=Cardiocondyla obscurior TaxID=286306 RepID=A0AAW2G7U4_9HYME